MRPAPVNAPAPRRPGRGLLGAYASHLAMTGRGNSAYASAARSFLDRWPAPQVWADQSLRRRLAAGSQVRPFITFLMVYGFLQPGWDYLVSRKLSSFWREVTGSPIEDGMARFVDEAVKVGYTRKQAVAVASQVIGRALIQTSRPIEELTVTDLDALAQACAARQAQTGKGWSHYRKAIHTAGQVLFHLQVT